MVFRYSQDLWQFLFLNPSAKLVFHRLQWISNFPKRNKSLNVSLEGFLQWRDGVPCSLHSWMSCYAQSFWTNLWPSRHPSSQSTWIAVKSYCTSSPFTIALHCSCAWSWAMAEKGRHVLCTTNSQLQKAWYTDGCLLQSWHMSRKYTDKHLSYSMWSSGENGNSFVT